MARCPALPDTSLFLHRSHHHTLYLRAQAPPPERETNRRKGVYTTAKSAKSNLSDTGYEEWLATQAVRDGKRLTSVPLPSALEDIVHRGMQAYFALDGSGELAPAVDA